MSTAPSVSPEFATAFGGNAAEKYERYFVATIGSRMADLLLAATDIRAGDRLLDVACGTGVVARRAADLVGPRGSVAGVDINPGMLATARSLADATGKSIKWYESSAEAMPLSEASFDAVTCQLGLMFVPDKAAALREMRRVLVPDGRLAIGVPVETAFFKVLDDALARHISPDVAGFVQTVFSVSAPALEKLLRDAQLRDVDVHVARGTVELPAAREFMWQYIESTPLSEFVHRARAEQIAALESEVVAGWKPWATPARDARRDAMTYEQELIIGTARKP